MQVTEVSQEGLKHEFKVTIPADTIAAQINEKLQNIQKNLKLPGFRPGKVPLDMVKKRHNDEILSEVLNTTVQETSQDVLKEKDLRPALQPQIKVDVFEEGKDAEYTLTIEVFPEVKLPEFESITVTKIEPDVTEADIDEGVERLAKAYRSFEKIEEDRPAENGDALLIDFKGSVDGEFFDGGTAEGHQLELGSGQFIPGFEDQLVGTKAGEEKTVKVTFPEQYGASELAGKDADFLVKVHEIRAPKEATIDEEFAKSLGAEDVVTLRDSIKEQLVKDYENFSYLKSKKELFDTLDEAAPFAVPEGMVNIEFDTLWKQLEQERGGELSRDAEENADLKAEYQGMSERRVRLGIVLAEVGRLNSIEVSQEEIRQAVYEQARYYQGQEHQVIEYYRNNPQALDHIKGPILEEKVVKFILDEKVKTEPKTMTAREILDAVAEEEKEENESDSVSAKKKAS